MDLPNPSSRAFKLSSEAGASFECSIDGGPFAPCGQIVEVGPLANGEHTLAARAADSAGNVDPAPASITFTIAVTPTPTPTPMPTPTPITIRGDQAFVLGWSNDLYLACTNLDLYLIDVLPRAARGSPSPVPPTSGSPARRSTSCWTASPWGRPSSGPTGSFAAKVRAPSARRRSTARYQARVGDHALAEPQAPAAHGRRRPHPQREPSSRSRAGSPVPSPASSRRSDCSAIWPVVARRRSM